MTIALILERGNTAMDTIRIDPLEWNVGTGEAKDLALFEAIMRFAEKEFGERLANLGSYQRVYAVRNEAGEVIALSGAVVRFDIPLFHVGNPNPSDRAAIRDALAGSDLLYNRMKHYIEDAGGRGFDAFVYVAPDASNRWEKFLARIGAVEAHRHMVRL